MLITQLGYRLPFNLDFCCYLVSLVVLSMRDDLRWACELRSATVIDAAAGRPGPMDPQCAHRIVPSGPEGQFTLYKSVRDGGGVASAATTLRYYRSTNATITT